MKNGIHPSVYAISGKKQTNADRIRSMSDEELAEFLHDYSNHACSYCKGCGVSCKSHNLAWLQSEVEEYHEID